MGFLNGNGSGPSNSSLVELSDKPTTVIPLLKAPQTVWGHNICGVTIDGPNNTKVTIRKFAWFVCSQVNRYDTSCKLHVMQDPLWDRLEEKEKYNKAGQRRDFQSKPRHYMPVYLPELKTIKILKGGNQVFEGMDSWYGLQQPDKQDLRLSCWKVWKEGTGRFNTKYKSMPETMPAVEITQAMRDEAARLLETAIKDDAAPPLGVLQKMIAGSTDDSPTNSGGFLPMEDKDAPKADSKGEDIPFEKPASVSSPNEEENLKKMIAEATPPSAPLSDAEKATTDEIQELMKWTQNQPELKGTEGMSKLIKLMKESVGTTDMTKVTKAQLGTMKEHFEKFLAESRKK